MTTSNVDVDVDGDVVLDVPDWEDLVAVAAEPNAALTEVLRRWGVGVGDDTTTRTAEFGNYVR